MCVHVCVMPNYGAVDQHLAVSLFTAAYSLMVCVFFFAFSSWHCVPAARPGKTRPITIKTYWYVFSNFFIFTYIFQMWILLHINKGAEPDGKGQNLDFALLFWDHLVLLYFTSEQLRLRCRADLWGWCNPKDYFSAKCALGPAILSAWSGKTQDRKFFLRCLKWLWYLTNKIDKMYHNKHLGSFFWHSQRSSFWF